MTVPNKRLAPCLAILVACVFTFPWHAVEGRHGETLHSEATCTSKSYCFDTIVASPDTPMHTVEPYYVSFALDNAFVRQPGVLPPDQTNSTRIDFEDELLRTVMPLVSGGLLRVGGTYTDFISYYVPNTNYTQCPYPNMTHPGAECPGNSFPCCLPLPIERWSELLHFANSTGIKIGFNLNVLHGRWPQYTASVRDRAKVPTPEELAPWDSSNARALLEWTVANIPEELWPAAFGLGNELAWFISPKTWAHDVETLASMLKEIFPSGRVPQVYAPCNANGDSVGWGGQFLDALHAPAGSSSALSAFTFHGYQHGGATVDAVVAGIQGAGIDTSRAFYKSIAEVHAQHAPKGAKLWITETAFSASAPANAEKGGSSPDVPACGMLRASDMPWYMAALGGAAEVGVDVFCKETLAGDWLETIGLWQPADAAAYTPHPDFWVAALWNKLMGTRALGANTTATGGPPPPPNAGWIVEKGMSNSYQACGLNGSATIPYLGTVDSADECEKRCVATAGCTSFSWDVSPASPNGWGQRCYGRLDGVWAPVAIQEVTSGCDSAKLAACRPSPPSVRVFTHCSRVKPSTVTFAFATVAPPGGAAGETVTLTFPGARSLTSYVLTASSPSDDFASLNGKRLTVSKGVLPEFSGDAITGDTVSVPLGAVGFVESDITVPACAAQ